MFEIIEMPNQGQKEVTSTMNRSNKYDVSIIDLSAIPGSLAIALEHHKSTRVGRENKDIPEEDKIKKKCKCCMRLTVREELKMKDDILSSFSYLGSGYPMFFYFLKLIIIFLSILFCISGIYNMVLNGLYGDNCYKREAQCKGNWVTNYALGNRMDDFSSVRIQEILNLTSVCVLIVFFQYLIYAQRKVDQNSDNEEKLPSDYSIMVEGIPLVLKSSKAKANQTDEDIDYDDELKDFFQNPTQHLPLPSNRDLEQQKNLNNENVFKVMKVNLGYKLDTLKSYQKELETQVKRKQKLYQKNIKQREEENKIIEEQKKDLKKSFGKNEDAAFQIKKEEEHNINQEIAKKQAELDTYERSLLNGKDVKFMQDVFSGVAIVTFQTEKMQERILEMDSKKQIGLFQNCQLKISRAPDPTDIHWENLSVPTWSRVLRVIVGLLLDSGFIVLSGVIVYYLSKYQSNYAADHKLTQVDPKTMTTKQYVIIWFLSLSITGVLTIMNFLLQRFLQMLSQFKKLKTKTGYNISFAISLSLAQFVNSSLVPMIVQFIIKKSSNFQMLYGPSGLIPNQNTVFIFNSFLQIIFWKFDFGYLSKLYFRNQEEKKIAQDKSTKTQQELCNLYEDPVYCIEYEYSQVMKTFFMTLFYATALPICVLWSIAGIVIQYVITKDKLISMRSAPFNIGKSLNLYMIEFMKLGLVLFACLSYVFIIMSKNDSDFSNRTYSYITIGIAAIHLFIPISQINSILFKIDKTDSHTTNPEDNSYLEQCVSFSSDYDRTNPATKRFSNKMYQELWGFYQQFKNLKQKTLKDAQANNDAKTVDTQIKDTKDIKSKDIKIQDIRTLDTLTRLSIYDTDQLIAEINTIYQEMKGVVKFESFIEKYKTFLEEIEKNMNSLLFVDKIQESYEVFKSISRLLKISNQYNAHVEKKEKEKIEAEKNKNDGVQVICEEHGQEIQRSRKQQIVQTLQSNTELDEEAIQVIVLTTQGDEGEEKNLLSNITHEQFEKNNEYILKIQKQSQALSEENKEHPQLLILSKILSRLNNFSKTYKDTNN